MLGNLAQLRGRPAASRRLGAEGRQLARHAGLPWAVRLPPVDIYEQADRARQALWIHGDASRAIRLMDDALRRDSPERYPWDQRPYVALVEFYARAGVSARARDFLRRYESGRGEKERADTTSGQYEAIAAIAAAERRYDEALAVLHRRQEKNPGCTMCRLYEIGEIHDAAGRPDSTITYYERFLSTPNLFRLGWDSGYRWLIYRRLGELYEARGDREKAADYYNRLVELWKSAEPELQPIVNDVKGRLTRLVGER